jgi:hypothetical protein
MEVSMSSVQNYFSDFLQGTQDFLSNAGTLIVDGATTAGNWTVEKGQIVGAAMLDVADKVYEFSKPYINDIAQWFVTTYETIRTFVSQHPQETMVGAVALAVGAIAMLVTQQMCCRRAAPPIPPAGPVITTP